jgi:phage-related protein
VSVPVSDLQAVAPSAIIELFELELNTAQHGVNETYRFHAGVNATGNNGDIIWAGNPYMRFPLEAEGFEYNGQGQLPRPKLRISNIFGNITAIILTLPSGLEGAKVTRIRTLGRYLDGANFPVSDILLTEDSFALLLEDSSSILLDPTNPTEDPTAEFPREIYYVDRKVVETRDVIEFELAAVFDLIGVRAPKRQCVTVCQWKYRGPECGYAGNAYFNTNNQPVTTLAQDACGKQLSSCELRFEQQRRTGSVTAGSNIITLTQASSFSAGDPVTGFGLSAGTTVSSVSGALVTLSQNAFASTGVVTTGTIQGNYTQIVVSSAAGITPGMAVVGNYLPANCQVVAVSGTTVTLSSTVDLTQFFSVVGSATSLVTVNFAVYFPQATSLTVGWFLASSVMPLNRYAQITGIRSVTTKLASGRNVIVSRYAVADISQNQGNNANAAWTFYVFAGIPSATYTFFATDQSYTFRANANIPFGSFPGVGQYTV